MFRSGSGLHGGEASEDMQELGVPGGRDLAEEEEFVHGVRWGRTGVS